VPGWNLFYSPNRKYRRLEIMFFDFHGFDTKVRDSGLIKNDRRIGCRTHSRSAEQCKVAQARPAPHERPKGFASTTQVRTETVLRTPRKEHSTDAEIKVCLFHRI
jgi:hypothetical protein